MMIAQRQLLAMLKTLEPWHCNATDLRKLSNGKIVRFVRWGWKAAMRQRISAWTVCAESKRKAQA